MELFGTLIVMVLFVSWTIAKRRYLESDVVLVAPGEPIQIDTIRRAKIKYIDAYGNSSNRIIRIRNIEDAGADTMLNAFCELKNEDRSFYASRMEEMINMDTGETIDNPPKYFRALRKLRDSA